MTKLMAGLAGALFLGLSAGMATAAPMGPAAALGTTAGDAGIVLVHGLHRTCQWDRYGHHRSRIFGRQSCALQYWHKKPSYWRDNRPNKHWNAPKKRNWSGNYRHTH